MCPDNGQVLQLEVDKQAARIIVYCTGKINTSSWTQFSMQVRALFPEGKPIKVDLNNVVQVDSVGIGTLVQVWASAKKNSCDLKYINPNRRVEDVIRITHLFPIFEGPELGVASGS